MAAIAIGYKQTIDYLKRENPKDSDEDSFREEYTVRWYFLLLQWRNNGKRFTPIRLDHKWPLSVQFWVLRPWPVVAE